MDYGCRDVARILVVAHRQREVVERGLLISVMHL